MGDNVEVIILASGSKGNALSITNEGKHILIDVGISFLILSNKLNEQGINIDDIDTLLLTHEHHDHTKGLKTLLKKKSNIKVYLTSGTYQGLSDDVKETLLNYEMINSEESFKLENDLFILTAPLVYIQFLLPFLYIPVFFCLLRFCPLNG